MNAEYLLAGAIETGEYKTYGFSAGCVGFSQVAEIPGATNFLAGWNVVNDRAIIGSIIGDVKAVSEEAARAYAKRAFTQWGEIGFDARFLVGMTASVRSNYQKRSPDEAWIFVIDRFGRDASAHIEFYPDESGMDISVRLFQNYAINAVALSLMGKANGAPFEPLSFSQAKRCRISTVWGAEA